MIRALSVVLAVAALSGRAWGFSWYEDTGCRQGRVILSQVGIISLNEISFPTGSPQENAFIQAQQEDSFATYGSFWRQTHNKYNSPWLTWDNGVSEAAFISFSQAGLPAWADGQTEWWSDSSWSWAHWCWYDDHITEADVMLNADVAPWDPNILVTPPGDNEKAVAQHELLHSAGFGHEPRWVAEMGAGDRAFFGLDRDLQLLHSDDKAGLRTLYGNGTTGVDVAIHGKKQLPIPPHPTFFDLNYGTIADVRQDTSVNQPAPAIMEITLENHGTGTVDTDLAIYLQPWNFGGVGAWTRVQDYTFTGVQSGYVGTWPLVVPSNVVPKGQYRVKMVVNDNGLLKETSPTDANDAYLSPTPLTIN